MKEGEESERTERAPGRLFTLLLGLFFLHGVCASGLIPILNLQLGVYSSWAFAAYFGGQLVGQLLIWRFGGLSRKTGALTVYEGFFAASFILMALAPAVWLSAALLLGRGLEGLAAGLALPLLFAQLVNVPVNVPMGARLVRYNACFSLGYVMGPFMVELALRQLSGSACLLAFAVAMLGLNLWLRPRLIQTPQTPDAELGLMHLLTPSAWLEKFYPLFFAKSAYGFMLAFVTAHAGDYFPGWPMSGLTLSLAVVFVAGQQIAAWRHKRLSAGLIEHLRRRILPLSIAGLLMAFALTGWIGLIYGAAMLHAGLLFLSLLSFTDGMESGRGFALFNSLSDPGLVMGALLAGWGLPGIGVLLGMGIVGSLSRAGRQSV